MGEQFELVRQLKDLAELHASGAITDDEFAAAKARVLNGQRPGGATPAPAPALQPTPPGFGAQASPPPRPFEGDTPLMLQPPGLPGPPPPMPRRPRSTPVLSGGWTGQGGAIAAGVGSVVALFAFIAMPIVTVPLLGSITGASLATHASEAGELVLLWLVPLAVVTVLALASHQVFGKPSIAGRRRDAIAVMVLAGLVMFVCLIGTARVQSLLDNLGVSRFGVSATSILGSGFWLILIGMLAAGIGGYRVLLSIERLRGPAG